MNTRNVMLALMVTIAPCVASHSIAQQTDVDEADTLDFGAFHTDKKEAVKVWESKDTKTTKAYKDDPNTAAAPASTPAAAGMTSAAVPASASTSAPATTSPNEGVSGKRFEIRQRYTLTRSAKTPYSAFYVIEPLYKQSAQLCPKGWKKLAERSEPVEQDFYLYYEIECL